MIKLLENIEFYYLKFYYKSEYCLVPRFETENLVREAINIININNIKTIIDIGTGSSIIPITIEKNTSSLKKIFGLDLSKKALKIAYINKGFHSSSIRLIHSDLLDEFLNSNILIEDEIVLLTANLPYIKNEDRANMGDDLKEEPKMALFGGKITGFELYERFFLQVIKLKGIYPNTKFILICEFGFDQKNLAENFFIKHKFKTRFFSDLTSVERFIYVEI